MKVEILKEEGLEYALRGMAYSYKDRAIEPQVWWTKEQYGKAAQRALKLAGKGGGHDKFLRQIQLWVDIEAPRCWWSEFDTYKVGTVAQSESTMHTLAKRPPAMSDFAEGTPNSTIVAFQTVWPDVKHDVTLLKLALPEGFLQRRLVTMNYEVLANVIKQRDGHRLKFWGQFIELILLQVQQPCLLPKLHEPS